MQTEDSDWLQKVLHHQAIQGTSHMFQEIPEHRKSKFPKIQPKSTASSKSGLDQICYKGEGSLNQCQVLLKRCRGAPRQSVFWPLRCLHQTEQRMVLYFRLPYL
jgi:hypothetical protein